MRKTLRKPKVKPQPMFGYKLSTKFSRWTGEPHEHKREIARRLKRGW